MREDQGWPFSGSVRCRILSSYTSTASTECWVLNMSSSQRWEPMNPPAPIMQMVMGSMGRPSRSTLAAIAREGRDLEGREGRDLEVPLY